MTHDICGSRILITGGNGFIARHLIKRLESLRCDVTSLSRTGNQSGKLQLDLTDCKQVKSLIAHERFDYVVHTAGVIDQGVRQGIYREQFSAHVEATINLVENLNLESLRRFIHIGSNAEYGSVACPQSMDGPTRPNSAYGASKLAASSLVMAKVSSEGLKATVVRPFLVYGPGQSDKSFLASALRAAKGGGDFPTTLGLQTRDFTPVDLVVDDILRAASSPDSVGKIVNSCTGHPIMIRNALEMLASLRPAFRPVFGAVPYRASELMDSYGIPYTSITVEQAKVYLGEFMSAALSS